MSAKRIDPRLAIVQAELQTCRGVAARLLQERDRAEERYHELALTLEDL